MPKLILHTGLHKTGTTAIQTFAHINRDAFRKKGFLYPDYKPFIKKQFKEQHDLAHTLAGKGKRLTIDQVEQLCQIWSREAFKNNSTVFLSSEAICRHVDNSKTGSWLEKRRAYLQKLAKCLSPFEVKAVIVLRRQDDYIKSLFQEHVMKNLPGGRQSFAQFRERFEKNKIHNRFYQNILLLEEFFPMVNVLLYEDLVSEGKLCFNFFTYFGVNVKGMKDVGIVRRSLSPRETVVKSFINQGIDSTKHNKKILAWVKSPGFQSFLNKHIGSNEFDLWESHQVRNDFLEGYRDENNQILKRYFPERKKLFPDLEQNTKLCIPSLSEQCKAKLVLYAFNHSLGLNISYIKYVLKRLKFRIFSFSG
jgi:hypothetical protein